MTTTHTPQPTTTATTAGERVELAHYDTDAGPRLLIGQRLDGIVHVFDEPAAGDQPSYLVETHLERNSELHALIDDYLAKAKRLGYSLLHGWF